MSLHDFQNALGRLVRSPALNELSLSHLRQQNIDAAEKIHIDELVTHGGLRFTKAVQRSWCTDRARSAARLVLSMLPEIQQKHFVEDWLAIGGGTSSIFANEAQAFLEFIASRLPAGSHELSICRLEQAVHRANSGRYLHACNRILSIGTLSCGNVLLCRGDYASFVDFYADPELILDTLQRNLPLPEKKETQVVTMLFAPGLPHFFRTANDSELIIWKQLHTVTRHQTLLKEGYQISFLEDCLAVGLLCIADEAGSAAHMW